MNRSLRYSFRHVPWSLLTKPISLIERYVLDLGGIRVPLCAKRIRDLYDFLSYVYDFLTRYEANARKKALAMADVREGFRVLEVGCGTGRALIEFAKKLTPAGEACSLDISRNMIGKTTKLVLSHNCWEQVHLVLADAGHCPFRNDAFEVVFSSYMLDLIDIPLIPVVLKESRRLLKTVGRVVLVSLAKGSKWYDNMKLYEWAYKFVSTVLGGYRALDLEPYLQQAGFSNLDSQLMHAGHLMPTKILRASP